MRGEGCPPSSSGASATCPGGSIVTCLPSAPLFSFIPLQVSCLLPTSRREALLLCKQNMSCLPGKMGCLERFPADCCAHIVAQDSCKRQSQRVALPAGEEPCPLRDLSLIVPCGPSWSPSLLPPNPPPAPRPPPPPRAWSCRAEDRPGREQTASLGAGRGQTRCCKGGRPPGSVLTAL